MSWIPELAVTTSFAGNPQLGNPMADTGSSSATSTDTVVARPATGPLRRTSSTHYEYICTVRDDLNGDKQCGVILKFQDGDHRTLITHLRESHGVQQIKLKTHIPGDSLIQCPDHYCVCRFRTRECSRPNPEGPHISHRSHVVDLLRHYLDRHVKLVHASDNKQYTCVFCERTFSRSGSVARHQLKAKSCMKGAP